MKNHTTILKMLILVVLVLWGCSNDDQKVNENIGIDICNDPCANPKECSEQCENESSGFNTEDLTPEGEITKTENGYLVNGSLTIATDSIGEVVFNNADLDVQFDEEGALNNITGTLEIPSPSNYFEFEDPIQADIGFFSGKYLNENRDFEILLVDDISYFVFNIEVNVELKIGLNNDPNAHKPFSIKPPLGGHITFIADYNDPMFFFSVGQDLLGGGSMGASFGGKIPYVPIQPVDDIVSFGGKTVRGGTFSFWKILEATGMYYENVEISANINLEEPMASNFGAGYHAGINGTLEVSAPIKSFVSFGFPIGQASAAIVTEATTNNGVTAKAFFNGLVEPDISWWPELIPLKPVGMLNAYGYVAQTGVFDFGLSGSLGIEMPSKTQAVEGSLRATNEAFTMEGKVINGNETWGVSATFKKEETEYIAMPPEGLLNGLSGYVEHKIDSTFTSVENAIQDLEEATKNYEFELSLRGLRNTLPKVISTALNKIDSESAAGIKAGRDKARKELNKRGRVLCSDNITSVVNNLTKRYKNALIRLRNSVNQTNDNDQTRVELESALRNLAGLSKIDEKVSVSIKHGAKLTGCRILTRTDTRSVSIKITVLSTEQVNKLNEAANNVKYISETSDIMIQAQQIIDQLPKEEVLERLKNLKDNIVNQVAEFEDLGNVGFIKNHDTGEHDFFLELGGERKHVSEFDIFDIDAVLKTINPELGDVL